MIRIRTGRVLRIISSVAQVDEVTVAVDGREERAVNYSRLTGPVHPGDEVILNTTAVHKKLGTGGTHFIMANINCRRRDAAVHGHIMKARYTPSQVKVLAVEEAEHPANSLYRDTAFLDGIPVVVAELHSMIAPVAAAVHKMSGGRARLVYLMTDGGALPLPLSRLAAELKAKGLLAATVTCGHAFGGDFEAVNVYSGLLAAKGVAGADIIVAAMGPGITGTGSQFGFTGLEQGDVVNAVHVLGGRPVAVPRISFADPRERHHGLSHHTRTALGLVALAPCTIPLPVMEPDRAQLVRRQLTAGGLAERHELVEVDGGPALEALHEYGIRVTTMGRSVEQDREFFLAAGAAGIYAAGLYASRRPAASVQPGVD
ncbi:DUF3866 family protein [Desulfotomaculum copahuensis]|uniref:DUF3866 domain-containing protein n=1 Tax=Desulfotomaculum copahuensis TaxID=1838280 RepID=A0A1B7LIU9_9FIRM|nr:DUF3866 family protein [Desulfotomaculum copahuensis]OAT86498.1 hypothetical protein A6M21_03525 [Desulfotomaculum copahuensis]